MWSYNTGDLLKKLISYEIFYDSSRQRRPFNTGDCLIEVTSWAGLDVYSLFKFLQVGNQIFNKNLRAHFL